MYIYRYTNELVIALFSAARNANGATKYQTLRTHRRAMYLSPFIIIIYKDSKNKMSTYSKKQQKATRKETKTKTAERRV